MPDGCFLAVHHFAAGARSLKSGRPIKCAGANGSPADDAPLSPGELGRRYGRVLGHVLRDEAAGSVDGRPMWSFVARKQPGDNAAAAGGVARARASGEAAAGTGAAEVGTARVGTARVGTGGVGAGGVGAGGVVATAAGRRGATPDRLEAQLHVNAEQESVVLQLEWVG
jgi:hypothetical protein